MQKPTVECALLAAMIANHQWGAPIGEDQLLAITALESTEYPAARRAYENLRKRSFVRNRGKRGIELDSSRFGELADVLHRDCGWEPFELRSRLHHYEGWDDHDWA